MIVAKKSNAPISPTNMHFDAVPNKKLCKNEDIPLTISASLAAKQSSLPRKRGPKNNHGNTKEYGIMITEQHQDTNRYTNDDGGDENDYTYNNQNQHIHYLTLNSNAGDYLRKTTTTGHLHRNANNNSTMALANERYRWYNQSDEIALQSLRNNSTNNTISTRANAMTMHSNQRSHASNRKHHNLNQINNNFILTNEKHSMNVHKTNNDQNSIDQNNGNHYPSRLYQ